MAGQVPAWDSRVAGSAFVKHWSIEPADLDRLDGIRVLTLWNVRFPHDFRLADLPALELVDIRGGTGTDLAYLEGATSLRGVVVNQVRGVFDLSVVSGLTGLRILSLYGLAQVETLPDLSALTGLERLEVGQMRGLTDWAGLASAPRVRELFLQNRLDPDLEVIDRLAAHPTLEAFSWSAVDVPVRISAPVRDRMSGLAEARAVRPEDWWAEHRTS